MSCPQFAIEYAYTLDRLTLLIDVRDQLTTLGIKAH